MELIWKEIESEITWTRQPPTAVAVFANEIHGKDGWTLVIGAAFNTTSPDDPVSVQIHKLHLKDTGSHTRDEVRAILKPVVERIRKDFPTAEKFIVRDGALTNFEDVHSFVSFEGFKNMYCLLHLIVMRICSLTRSDAAPNKTYGFRNENNEVVTRSVDSFKTFTNMPDHLLMKNLTKTKAATSLNNMANCEFSHRLWTMLESNPGDPEHNLLKCIRSQALLYRSILRGESTTKAKKVIDNCINDTQLFRYRPLNPNVDMMAGWNTPGHATLETLSSLDLEIPLQMMTLCFDEHILSAAKKLIDSRIDGSVKNQPITFDSIQETIHIISREGKSSVHCSYGVFTLKVLFLAQLK